jgi:hypothetical protein
MGEGNNLWPYAAHIAYRDSDGAIRAVTKGSDGVNNGGAGSAGLLRHGKNLLVLFSRKAGIIGSLF